MRDEQGQVLPALLVVVVATLALGVAFFSVGRASNLRTEAQTAADAAALAAANDLRDQLRGEAVASLVDILLGPGVIDLSGLQDPPAQAAAADFAGRNRARLVGFERSGRQVRVAVATLEGLGGPGTPEAVQGRSGEAEAAAEVTVEFLVDLPLLPLPVLPTLPPLLPTPLPPVDDIVRFEVRLIG